MMIKDCKPFIELYHIDVAQMLEKVCERELLNAVFNIKLLNMMNKLMKIRQNIILYGNIFQITHAEY